MFSTPDSWDRRAAGNERGPAQLPGAIVWLVLVWLWWFETGRETLGASLGDQATPRLVLLAALGGTLGRIASQLVETGFYVALWRGLGRRLAFGPLFVAIASLSLFDVAAISLVQWVGDSSRAWLVPVIGFQAIHNLLAAESGLRLAFGGFGLTCLLRLLGTAEAQKPTGAPWRWRAALTLGAWLAGRLVTWWTTDLVRGVSPIP